MSNVIPLHPEVIGPLEDDISPSRIAKKWRSIWYQIQGRVAMLLASKHGKRYLRPGTAEKLRSDILERCKFLEKQKIYFEDSPEELRAIIRAFARKKSLLRGSRKWSQAQYNQKAIQELLTIGKSEEEYLFIEKFLALCGVKDHVLRTICIRPIFNRQYNN